MRREPVHTVNLSGTHRSGRRADAGQFDVLEQVVPGEATSHIESAANAPAQAYALGRAFGAVAERKHRLLVLSPA